MEQLRITCDRRWAVGVSRRERPFALETTLYWAWMKTTLLIMCARDGCLLSPEPAARAARSDWTRAASTRLLDRSTRRSAISRAVAVQRARASLGRSWGNCMQGKSH